MTIEFEEHEFSHMKHLLSLVGDVKFILPQDIFVNGTLASSGKRYCSQEPGIRRFLHELSSTSPVCAYIPPMVWVVLKDSIIPGGTFQSLSELTHLQVGNK